MNKEYNPKFYKPVTKRIENIRPYSIQDTVTEVQTGLKVLKAERTLTTRERRELKKIALEQINNEPSDLIPLAGEIDTSLEVTTDLDYGELMEGELFSFVPSKK